LGERRPARRDQDHLVVPARAGVAGERADPEAEVPVVRQRSLEDRTVDREGGLLENRCARSSHARFEIDKTEIAGRVLQSRTMPTPSADEILARSRAQWTAAAPSWEREGDLVAASTRAVTAALVEMAGLAPGMRVLDVAGGTGDPTTAVTAAVGDRGCVVCTDLTPAMLAGARRRVGEATVDFIAASAEALP